jgi:hypothetical protein
VFTNRSLAIIIYVNIVGTALVDPGVRYVGSNCIIFIAAVLLQIIFETVGLAFAIGTSHANTILGSVAAFRRFFGTIVYQTSV